MDSLTVHTSTNTYCVHIGVKLRYQLNELVEKNYKNVLIITDSQVADLYLDDITSAWSKQSTVSSVVVPAGESSKSQDQFYKLITKAIDVGLDRNSLIVALGGGMVGDLAGFVAATYMRGIDYIQVPTTILAHDSSVGGKVAINHSAGKNLIGNFYPPQAVIYDVETLQSLPNQEVRSGYAEVVKHGLISDYNFFEQIISLNLNRKIPAKLLSEHLLNGIRVKASIVENDEKESNVRKHLNFGHTLGHAIEAELGYGRITHGEAVAIGMLFAIRVSNNYYQIELPYNKLYTWLQENSFPLQLSNLSIDSLMNRMKQDKKAINQDVHMVLLKEIGEPTMERINDEQIRLELTKFFEELEKN